VDVKVGDIYIRNSDRMLYRVKAIDNIKVILESEDRSLLSITDIYGLQKAYTKKKESKVTQ
jgi:propanediol utilization protein